MKQRYVSRELTHFVGRGVEDERKQYEILLKILHDGWLFAGGLRGRPSEGVSTMRIHAEQRLSGNKLLNYEVVCFCDIPLADLAIHVEKYGRFGLAFSKPFLSAKGAAPVFYIPAGPRFYGKTGAAIFDKFGEHLLKARWRGPAKRALPKDIRSILHVLDLYILSLFKFFDESKGEADPDNYYMEREWRTITSVMFNLDDVARIILPKAYSRQFRQDIPAYAGQLSFVD